MSAEDLQQAMDNLSWLYQHGAEVGVAEVIRERRRHIEQLGYSTEHDRREHAGGGLVHMATSVIMQILASRYGGTTAGPAEAEIELTQTAALCAAEIDRLAAEFTPDPEPVTYRCWITHNEATGSTATHHVHGPGQPCPLKGD